MKLTRDMFHDWTDGDDTVFDDELIIEHDPKISSKSIADQILADQKLRELVKAKLRDETEFVEMRLGSEANQLHHVFVKRMFQELLEESTS